MNDHAILAGGSGVSGRPAQAQPRSEVGFLFNHYVDHQVLHGAPIAFELSRLLPAQIGVTLIAGSAATARLLERIAARYPGHGCRIVTARISIAAWLCDALIGRYTFVRKRAVLWHNKALFAQLDALVVPERHSALLKNKYGLERLQMINVSHGVEHRWLVSDVRMKIFDLVLVPGRMAYDRFTSRGLVAPERCRIIGCPKIDLVNALDSQPRKPFANDRPVVLYNPHFNPRESSWYGMGTAVLEYFRRSPDYNLIFAPHVVLFKRPWRHRVRIPRRFRACPNILIDAGSEASIDMSYIRAADIYLGDVSSQAYEFWQRPRPSIFLNAHAVRWQDAPEYRHWPWHGGEVIDDVAQLGAALSRAAELHRSRYRAEQERLFAEAFDRTAVPSAVRAATVIAEHLEMNDRTILAADAGGSGRLGVAQARIEVGFLFNHPVDHQVLHGAPIAFELSRLRPAQIGVTLIAGTAATARLLKRIAALYPGHTCRIGTARVSIASRLHDALVGRRKFVRKRAVLKQNKASFARLSALVVPELTSARLKNDTELEHLRMIHVSHGPEHRWLGRDERLKVFDLALVAGRLAYERFTSSGLVAPERCRIVGYPKFDLVEALDPEPRKWFANDRPVVLYNPHFRPAESSWYGMGEAVLDFFRRCPDYNLIFAPHVVLFKRRWRHRVRVPWRFRFRPNILIDTGSEASIDMSYTRAADIYLGDVSSQAYEFWHRPRPSIFLNAHAVRWQEAPDYRHWHGGEVIDDVAQLGAALSRAAELHRSRYRAEQERLFANAFDRTQTPSAVRAARAIAEYMIVKSGSG